MQYCRPRRSSTLPVGSITATRAASPLRRRSSIRFSNAASRSMKVTAASLRAEPYRAVRVRVEADHFFGPCLASSRRRRWWSLLRVSRHRYRPRPAKNKEDSDDEERHVECRGEKGRHGNGGDQQGDATQPRSASRETCDSYEGGDCADCEGNEKHRGIVGRSQ